MLEPIVTIDSQKNLRITPCIFRTAHKPVNGTSWTRPSEARIAVDRPAGHLISLTALVDHCDSPSAGIQDLKRTGGDLFRDSVIRGWINFAVDFHADIRLNAELRRSPALQFGCGPHKRLEYFYRITRVTDLSAESHCAPYVPQLPAQQFTATARRPPRESPAS